MPLMLLPDWGIARSLSALQSAKDSLESGSELQEEASGTNHEFVGVEYDVSVSIHIAYFHLVHFYRRWFRYLSEI